MTKKLYDSLITDLENKDYDEMFVEALQIYGTVSSDFQFDTIQTRSKAQTLNPEEAKVHFKTSLFKPIVSALLSNLKARAKIYEDLDSQYSFLIELNLMSNEEIANSCKKIVAKYPKDLNLSQLIDECQFAKNYFTFNSLNYESIYSTMFKDNLYTTFPNIDILLRMYLCMFVNNVLDERSFSKLKLIKTYLRNTMTDDRLNNLSILSIESDILCKLKFDEIIDQFVNLKYRKTAI